ncbi:MAG: hypothetical protein KUG71_09045 [Porticoccaceae bacterium]|nr:hypothetical protein [Porticoccaceae bacterium]
MRPLVIIHGWSDHSDSFHRLAKLIADKTDRQVQHLWLSDYVSLDDQVQMSDITAAMQRAWTAPEHGLPVSANSCDAIIHSTGGLVIREWMADYWHAQGKRPPIANLVMLAPANFGSPLAHKGRALIGRVFKGFGSDKRFETGTHILKALEMASPYSWALAEKDRFVDNVFNKGGVRCTVIVGNEGYDGISSIANEDGSDGTVYVATANLNCARLTIDFATNPEKPTMSALARSKGEIAFLVVDGKNHSTLAFKDTRSTSHLDWVIGALDVKAGGFAAWREQCLQHTGSVMAKHNKPGKRDAHKHGYQNMVFRVRDDMGNHVHDFVLEFYEEVTQLRDKLARAFNRDVISSVHAYKDDGSYRSFVMNCTRLFSLINKPDEFLKISLSALPDVDSKKEVVGYSTFGNADIGCVELDPARLQELFQSNRTVLVDIILKRMQDEQVFTLKTFA